MSVAAGKSAGALQIQRVPQVRAPAPRVSVATSILRSDRSLVDFAEAIARSQEQLRQAIAEAAYYRAQQRGFAPGHELEDWLAAQHEISGEPE
jgi:hypothetical protein